MAWTRLTTNLKAVGSVAVSPSNPDELYLATEDQGLWFSANRRAVAPTFTALTGYPFRFPTRVFFNPYDANEIWVTSFGNGMRLGRVQEPRPSLQNLQRNGTSSTITLTAAPGQKVVLAASPDLRTWTPAATNVMFTSRFIFSEKSPAPTRYYRAEVH